MIVDPAKDVDPARFRTLAELEAGLEFLPQSPSEEAALGTIVSRTASGHRAFSERVALTVAEGVPGDGWIRKEGATVDSQITVMETSVAELIANGQPLALFGDNLFVDLDLSIANLPPGSRVTIGDALLEVTTKIHKGCKKFVARFGVDALRFVATPVGRERRFRGLYLKVVEEGAAAPGDTVTVVERASLVEQEAV
jgi:MOSC domain-containing protein YiiM